MIVVGVCEMQIIVKVYYNVFLQRRYQNYFFLRKERWKAEL